MKKRERGRQTARRRVEKKQEVLALEPTSIRSHRTWKPTRGFAPLTSWLPFCFSSAFVFLPPFNSMTKDPLPHLSRPPNQKGGKARRRREGTRTVCWGKKRKTKKTKKHSWTRISGAENAQSVTFGCSSSGCDLILVVAGWPAARGRKRRAYNSNDAGR